MSTQNSNVVSTARPPTATVAPALFVATLVVAPLAAWLAVAADISISTGQWPVLPGAVAVVAGMMAAFCGLAVPVMAEPKSESRLGGIASSIFVLAAATPAVIAGSGVALQMAGGSIPDVSRVGLVLSSALLAVAFRRSLAARIPAINPTPAMRGLDIFRQGLLMLVVAAASLLYVSMPASQVVIQ